MISRKSIRAGETLLIEHGLGHYVPQFRRSLLLSMYLQRAEYLCVAVFLFLVLNGSLTASAPLS